MTGTAVKNSEEQLREALRMSKVIQGLPVKKQTRTLTEEDANAIADAVVERLRDVFLIEAGRLVWDGIRKLVITGSVLLFVVDQLKAWLR